MKQLLKEKLKANEQKQADMMAMAPQAPTPSPAPPATDMEEL